jgi:hypothetical protein
MLTKTLIRNFFLGASLCLVPILSQAQHSPVLVLSAWLTGDQEIPAVNTTGHGVVTVSVSPDLSRGILMGHVNDLGSSITKVELYEGAVGQPGNLIQPLTLTGNAISGSFDLDQVELKSLLSGMYFVQVFTGDHPTGEIRGQLKLEQDNAFVAAMSGKDEVPAVTTNGEGLVVARLSADGMTLSVHGMYQELSGPATAAHIHFGAPGSSGSPVLTLTTTASSLTGGTIDNTFDLSSVTNAKEIIDSITMGHMYVNVHTLSNSNGEIRGQLTLNPGITFDAMLTGDQETPSVTTTAKGVGYFQITPDLSALNFDVMVTGLSGAISDAHLHMGAPGVKGGVILPLSSFVNGNRISGAVDFINLPNWHQLYEAAITGMVYVNVHTSANPGGEIRGQLMPNAREAYIFNMNGAQEVPAVNTTARGFGVATIDREQTNMHYMAVWSGLSGSPTAAHFHVGGPGEKGSPILDVFSQIDNNSVAGYWSGSSFISNAALFNDGRVYFNVHTAANGGGEIRGNLIQGNNMFTRIPNQMFDGRLTFSAMLNGAQETPAVNTNAAGVAGLQLSPGMDTLWIMMQVNGLSSAITNAHIHEGAMGVPGSPIQDINLFRKGNKFYGMLTGSALDNLIGKMIEGKTYLNVHTANNPNGEIRGQIMLESDYAFHANMSGANEVPATLSSAKGIAVVHLSHDKTMLHVQAFFTGLSSAITGAHLHIAKPGTGGPVIVDLAPYLHGNMIDAHLRTYAWGARLDSLLAGDVYINVHTTDNPNGEIRGQLMMAQGLAFMTTLDGAQETPPVPTQGMGLGYFEISPGMNMMSYQVVFSGLSGAPTAAHFHKAPVGISGGVVVNLADSMTANEIKGSLSGTNLTKAFIMDAIAGKIYINVHTPAYSGGEIRGQIVRFARQGFVFDLCPGQETGPVTSAGKGIGVVSISPELNDVHYMIAIDSLSGSASGQHFHSGAASASGLDIFTLNSFTNGISSGYWSDSLLTGMLTRDLVRSFQAGNIYVNVHTANNPGGEIRGQVMNRAECERLVGFGEEPDFNASVNAYPNPFTGSLTLQINAANPETYTLRMFDARGKEILENEVRVNAGSSLINVELNGNSSGLYLLQLSNGGGQTLSKKLMRY